jgi:hypothetical protein
MNFHYVSILFDEKTLGKTCFKSVESVYQQNI